MRVRLSHSVKGGQLTDARPDDLDAWDGYQANRERILDHLQSEKIGNTLILAGDSHANWVSDLARMSLPPSFLPRATDPTRRAQTRT
jgi:alkaline phosphatase D